MNTFLYATRSMLWPCLLLLPFVACQPETATRLASNAEIREILLQADRDFESLTQARGIDGWMSYMAADAARLDLGQTVTRGLANIRESDTPLFASDSVRLRWQPVDGGVFADVHHGFTTGKYQIVRLQPDGSARQVGQGHYLTLWRKEADGSWKIILDGGSAGPPPTPQSDS